MLAGPPKISFRTTSITCLFVEILDKMGTLSIGTGLADQALNFRQCSFTLVHKDIQCAVAGKINSVTTLL
jgi:hypothetical protein